VVASALSRTHQVCLIHVFCDVQYAVDAGDTFVALRIRDLCAGPSASASANPACKVAPWPLMPPRPTVASMPWSSASPPIRADGTCSGRSRHGAASSSSSSPNVADEQCRRAGNLTNRCSLKDRQRLPLSLRIPRPCPVSIRRRNRAPARGPPWRRSTPMKNQACEHLAETRSSRSKTICVDKLLHDARHEICISN
jgi:hypothetical protein